MSGFVHAECRRKRQRGQVTIRLKPHVAEWLWRLARDEGCEVPNSLGLSLAELHDHWTAMEES